MKGLHAAITGGGSGIGAAVARTLAEEGARITILGRSIEGSRQLASRARKRVHEETGPSRFEVDPSELRRIADRFITAATDGDVDALMDVLDPNVVGWTDTGGMPGTPTVPIEGRAHVANQFLRFMRSFGVTLHPMPVNGEPGVMSRSSGNCRARTAKMIATDV